MGSMVKTRAKGNRIQRKAITLLEDAGYRVSKAEQGGKFNTEKDLFGIIDLVAIKKDLILFVQVTCNRPHTHKDYEEFIKQYENPGMELWQMVHFDNKGWVFYHYLPNNKIRYDMRRQNNGMEKNISLSRCTH